MKVKLGALELEVTFDELDELVRRYGNVTVEGSVAAVPPQRSNNGRTTSHGTPADIVVLNRLVAAPNGVSAREIGEILGRRGKAIRRGAREWAVRIGLVNDENVD